MIKLLSNPQTETSSPVFKLGDDVICQAYPGEEIYIANIKGNIALCLGYSGKSGNFQQEIPLSNLSLAVEVKAKIEVISTPKILPIEPTPASFKIGDHVYHLDRPNYPLTISQVINDELVKAVTDGFKGSEYFAIVDLRLILKK